MAGRDREIEYPDDLGRVEAAEVRQLDRPTLVGGGALSLAGGRTSRSRKQERGPVMAGSSRGAVLAESVVALRRPRGGGVHGDGGGVVVPARGPRPGVDTPGTTGSRF